MPNATGWTAVLHSPSRVTCGLLLSVVLLGTGALGAQTHGGVLGRIVDVTTREPIQGVGVELELEDRSMIAITDAAGQFRFRGIPEGEHSLRIQHLTYGAHYHRIAVDQSGGAAIEISLSPTAIQLAPILVQADRSREFGGPESPASRNVLTREEIAGFEGSTLSELLGRGRILGLRVRESHQVGGTPCIEFRPDLSDTDGLCRTPQVFVDGIPTHPDALRTLSLSELERIQVVPPSEAGVRYGARSGYGAILLQTRRGALVSPSFPDVQRTRRVQPGFDWSAEADPYPWARVYIAAVAGNAVGLAAGMAMLSQCMDLETRRIYRNEGHCGAPMLLGSGLAAVTLPAIGGSLAARGAGATDQSAGILRYSALAAHAVFVPGYALASMNDPEGGTSGLEVAGLVVIVAAAPLLNTLADRLFRHTR